MTCLLLTFFGMMKSAFLIDGDFVLTCLAVMYGRVPSCLLGVMLALMCHIVMFGLSQFCASVEAGGGVVGAEDRRMERACGVLRRLVRLVALHLRHWRVSGSGCQS